MIDAQINLGTVAETMRHLSIQVHKIIANAEFVILIRQPAGQRTRQQVCPRAAQTNIIRGLSLDDRSLKLHAGIEQADTICTMEVIHVAIRRAHIYHGRQSSSISSRETALVEVDVLHDIRVETGKQTDGMVDLIKWRTIYQKEVLISIATMHIKTTRQFLTFHHTAHPL